MPLDYGTEPCALDEAALKMTTAMQRALKQTGGKGTGKPRWDPGLKSFVTAMRQARKAFNQSASDRTLYEAFKEKREEFCAEVRRAKREWWRQSAESVKDANTGHKMGTSQEEIDKIRLLLHEWEGDNRNFALEVVEARVRWVPGHTEIPGNEEVDRLAKL